MDPSFSHPIADQNFEFAFNSSNFSDRVLRIEIVPDPAESRSDGEGCGSILDWARHRKRRREDMKKEKGTADCWKALKKTVTGTYEEFSWESLLLHWDKKIGSALWLCRVMHPMSCYTCEHIVAWRCLENWWLGLTAALLGKFLAVFD